MTKRIEKLLEFLKSAEYKKERTFVNIPFEQDDFDIEKQMELFIKSAEAEQPNIFSDDLFGFNRSTDFRPPIREGNITPNYMRIISTGFEQTADAISQNILKTDNPEKQEYGKNLLKLIEICIGVSDKYRQKAQEMGNTALYNALNKIPQKGADTLYEALVFMKFITFCLRLYGVSHIGLGRFDQYLYPYYVKEKESGATDDQILELIEEFFISLNYDTDLYHGMQQGDNGQSIVLGGFDGNGNNMYNELSGLCMESSLELSLIDPKINLRVSKNTPDEIYEFATLLTKQGLGFPQYCNDDVVVPGLIKLGYSREDALNYTVAACWEYIIPNCGADIPNFNVMDFPAVVGRVIREHLSHCETFEELMEYVKKEISAESAKIAEERNNFITTLCPLLSIFVDGCIESLSDMRRGGAKYMNYGCHGAGIANATDSLAAVKAQVYGKKTIEKDLLIKALDMNFEGFTSLRNLLKNSPKMGNNDDEADEIATELMEAFSVSMNNRKHAYGGVWRAGTGSAMEYIYKGHACPATADGRGAFEPYSSSFSPSLGVAPAGLLSVIKSFTKFDMTNIINGGPLTIEIHDSVLKNDIGIKKVAQLVKTYICLGGHQLQLNSLNCAILSDAQEHPEKYPDLIVRVWGWSGYFNEIDVDYQNHIIKRYEYLG